MGLELMHVERIRLAEESTGSANFAQELSGSISSFKDLRYDSGEAGINVELLRDERRVQRTYTEPLDVVGASAASLSVSFDLAPTGTGLDSGGSPAYTNWGQGILLKTCMGGYAGVVGTTETGTSTASAVEVTDASTWTENNAVGYLVGGLLEARLVANPDTAATPDRLDPMMALSAAPDGSSIVYGSHTFYLADDPNTSLQAIVEEADRDDLWWLLGLQAGGLSFTLERNQLVKMGAELIGADYSHDDDVATPLGGSALSAGTLSDGGPVPAVASEVLFGPASSDETAAARTVIQAESISLQYNPAAAEQPSPSGVNGIRRYRIMPNRPAVTVDLTMAVESSNILTYENARKNRTKYYFQFQAGNTAGGTVLIACPTVQITNVQRAPASNGLHGVTVSFKSLENENYASGTTLTDEIVSPFVVALL